jgi:hypothetical protein
VVRKDCSAAVPAVEVPVVAVLLDPVPDGDVAVDADVAVLVADVPDVVPPKSAISLVNAAFKLDRVFDDRFDGVPAAADVVLTTWLLLKSWMSAVSSATMPCRPYCPTPLPVPEVVVTGVVVAGVVVTGVVVVVAGVAVTGVVVVSVVAVVVDVLVVVDAVVGVLLVVTGTGVLLAGMG